MTNPIDRHVGERIRQRRTMLGMTQDDLASALGVSYQQVQKYETAANRISAGRLFEIARHLRVGVSYLFEGLDSERVDAVDGERRLPHGGRMRATIDVAQHFSGISDAEVRAAIASLVKTLDRRSPPRHNSES